VYPILFEQHVVMLHHVHHEEGHRHGFAPNRYLLQINPFASVGSPSTWLTFLNSNNGKMLMLAPPSTSMCLIGIPSR
jgi:hypothetical protein